MTESYKLNPQMAREGDSNSSRITESGAYTGVIKLAESITAGTGAKGVELTFESSDKQTANYLTMYTKNKSGESIYGEKQLHALMACMSVREINPTSMQVMKYDFQAKKELSQTVSAYQELMNKPIGLVLQKEEYLKGDGSTGDRMSLFAFFNADSKKTAVEILDDKPAAKLESMLASLKDKKLSNSDQGGSSQSENPSIEDDFDDDIPF